MRLIWVLASLVFLTGSIIALLHELRVAPLRELGEAVDTLGSLPEASPESQKRIEAVIKRLDDCDRRLARSRVAASLFLLRRGILDSSGIDARAARFIDVENAVNYALACRPLDGTLWFMIAKLNWISAFESRKFHDFVHMSISTEPYEGEAVHARWRFLAVHLKQTGMADDPRLIEDLQTELRFDRVQEANWVAQTLRRNGEASLVDQTVALLPPERQQALAYAADPSMPPPDPLSKYHQFQIAPFSRGNSIPAKER